MLWEERYDDVLWEERYDDDEWIVEVEYMRLGGSVLMVG